MGFYFNHLDAFHRHYFTSRHAVYLLLNNELWIVALTEVTCFFLKCNFVLRKLRISSATRRKCLVKAVAEILWRAGEEKQAVIAMYDLTFGHTKHTHIQTPCLL